MLKKIGIPMMALAGALMFAAPHPAKAGVRFGVGIGVPVYTAPAYPVYPAPYPYVAPAPVYPGPAYVAPYVGFGGGWGWGHGPVFHGRAFHGRR
jgi:hypothetical protein